MGIIITMFMETRVSFALCWVIYSACQTVQAIRSINWSVHARMISVWFLLDVVANFSPVVLQDTLIDTHTHSHDNSKTVLCMQDTTHTHTRVHMYSHTHTHTHTCIATGKAPHSYWCSPRLIKKQHHPQWVPKVHPAMLFITSGRGPEETSSLQETFVVKPTQSM